MRLILGTQSPRRKEIFDFFSLPFEQKTSSFDEQSIPYSGNPEEFVLEISEGKAKDLAQTFPDCTILTADTIVVKDRKIYEKPTSREEANQFLSELTGNWHTVFTGVTLYHNKKFYNQAEESRVLMNPFNQNQIQTYLDSLKWSDKAGGYAIQGAGGIIIQRIEGCFYNIMGLPINTVSELMQKIGIHLWEYMK